MKMGIWLSQLMSLPTKWRHERSKGIHSFVVVSWKKCQICSTSTFSWPLVWKKLRVELNHICVALLVNSVLSLLFFTVDCELSLLSAKKKSSGELHAPRKTRRTRDSRRAPNIRLKNIYRCVLRVPCPSGLARNVYFTRSLIFSRCWRLRAVYFLPLRLILLECFHLNV